MKYYLSVFVGLIYFLFPSFSFAYEATCTFEYGLVDSGTFDISVNQGMLTQRFKPTSVGNTSIPERTSVYKFQHKTGDVFCYQSGNEYSDDLFDYGVMCVGKFDDGKFPLSLRGHDGIAYGTCTLRNQGTHSSTRVQAHEDKGIPVPEVARANGFIALSDSSMNWTDAIAWCQRQGGRLPRINNSESLPFGNVPIVQVKRYFESSSIDGFGNSHRLWSEVGLPSPANYWTGTVISSSHPSLDGQVYTVGGVGEVSVYGSISTTKLRRVACVSQE